MVFQNNLPERVQRRFRKLYDRARYRLGLPDPDPGTATLSSRFRHPIDAAQRATLVARYRELFPEAVDAELAEARRLASRTFTFLGQVLAFDGRVGWSRDPVSGRDWDRGFSPKIVYRGPARLGDIKIPWELNKHQYFFTLGKAAWLTDDSAPALEIVRQIDEWIADSPFRRGINWISALEVGTRAVSWILAYPFYAPLADDAFRRRFTRSLAQHMVFVEDHLSVGRFANNHLVGDSAALVVGGLFLEHRHSGRWVEKGIAHLETEMQRQVVPDGVHAERSISYHRFVLDQYHLINAVLAHNGRSFSNATRQGMERMTEFLADVIAPDGRSPFFGDGDDARGMWFRADCPSDFRSALGLGTLLFQRGDFKAIAPRLPEEVFWLFGLDGVRKFEAVAPRQPDHTSIAYPEGGYYVMRQGWEESDAVLTFDCGPVGHGRAGHGHADALSLQLHAAGFPFLIDPGAFSYNLDYDWRHVFRSTRAHNTITVDGQDQSIPADRMAWSHMAQARPLRWTSSTLLDIVDGEHDGYRRLPDPVTHRRAVAYIKPDTWVICDIVKGGMHHDVELLWHVRPDCAVDVSGDSILLQSPNGARLSVATTGDDNEPQRATVLIGTDAERAAWFSPSYGTRLPSRALSVRRQFTGLATLITLLSTSNPRARAVHRDGALTVDIESPSGTTAALYYRLEGAVVASPEDAFDGDLLFTRGASATSQGAVFATNFRRLSAAPGLEVHAKTPVDRLELVGNQCDIAARDAHDLRVSVNQGVAIRVNGKAYESADQA